MARLGGAVFLKNTEGIVVPSTNLPEDQYDEEYIARLHRINGYRAAYAPDVSHVGKTRLPEIVKAFGANDVVLAEMGFWENILDSNPQTRRKNREEMCSRLAAADEMGVVCFVTTIGAKVAGTVNDNVYMDENIPDEDMEEAIDFTNRILKEVNPQRTRLTYEMFALTALDSVEQMQKMLAAIDHPGFGVHLDLTNLFSSARSFFYRRKILKDCVDAFGARIISCHVKDMVLKPGLSVVLEERPIGKGSVDIGEYLKAMHGINEEMPVMLEHMNTCREYAEAVTEIKKIAAKVNVPL